MQNMKLGYRALGSWFSAHVENLAPTLSPKPTSWFGLDDETDFARGTFSSSLHDGNGIVPSGDTGGSWTSPVLTPNRGLLGGLNSSGMAASRVWITRTWLTWPTTFCCYCELGGISSLADSSGSNHVATAIGDEVREVLDAGQGVVGESCSIGIGNQFSIPQEGTNLSANTSDLTLALWINTTMTCQGNDIFIGADAVAGRPTYRSRPQHKVVGSTDRPRAHIQSIAEIRSASYSFALYSDGVSQKHSWGQHPLDSNPQLRRSRV